MNKKLHLHTRLIHDTQLPTDTTGAVANPIHLSTTFLRNSKGDYPGGFVYARADNPNRHQLEQSLAVLEQGAEGFAFSSGMAAVTTLFQTLKTGEHLLLPHDAYYSTKTMARQLFGNKGIEVKEVNMTDLEAVSRVITPQTAIVWLETPSNPLLNVCDIAIISQLAHQKGAICGVDNTWSSPLLQQPLLLGADVVMHSTSKYLSGHSDVIGGALVVKESGLLADQLREIQILSGSVPSAFDCWLVTRGLKTLAVRLQQQVKNAAKLARFLEKHPKIQRVNYPGLASHPQHSIAQKQMTDGFGAMLSVEIQGNAAAAMELTGHLQLFTTATSLGGVESLVEHRKSIEGEDSPTPDNLLRVSVGLEYIDDLIADWSQALKRL